ncbi:hypothetical protein [Mangrovibacterium marinum]|uniref:Uncharacterized protein n=1 Tax=Mangrovibacterium marinum TaxID=1639118 RepID=A0A2T5C1C4_9BACT|nr:hypothetical protein [Mangrovibacterium marinum]PTN08414.1 hypothetical protein C8N47_109150 [Mangrovibacterium marinum]
MDQHKLLRIIQKNLAELSDINSEMSSGAALSRHEVDLALSKAKLILQEYEILHEINEQQGQLIEEAVQQEPTATKAPELEASETTTPLSEVANTGDIKKSPPEKPVISHEDTLSEVYEEEEDEPVTVSIPHPEPVNEDEAHNTAPEPERTKAAGKTLTDQFQSRSLNDLLTATKKLDQHFASSPISKLENAIGINDRFQYIRELFSNDAELFRDTIGKLDRMHSLDEAAQHLDTHFKWEKDDTSLQFLHLVKRRFSN